MWDQRLRTVLKPAVRHLLGLWHLLQLGDSKGLNLNGSYPNTPTSGSLWGTGWKRGRTGNKPATVSPLFNEPSSGCPVPVVSTSHPLERQRVPRGSPPPPQHLWDPLDHPNSAANSSRSLLGAPRCSQPPLWQYFTSL